MGIGLLALPQEVRDEILGSVIFTRNPTPKTLADLEAQIRVPDGYSTDYTRAEDPIQHLPDAHSLFLVNRQIHHETKALLNLRGNTYKLDVKFVYESLLVPTWTSVPLAQELVPRLKITIQSLEKFRQGAKFRGQSIEEVPGARHGVPSYVLSLRNLIWQSLWRYPFMQDGHGAKKTPLAFRVVEIDFIDPEDKETLAPDHHSPGDYMCLQAEDNDPEPLVPPAHEQGLARPEWLAAGFVEHLSRYLSRGVYIPTLGQMHYDLPLLARIGELVVQANGRTIGNLDIGQILADIKFVLASARPGPHEHWIDHFILWKETAMQRRRQRGYKDADIPVDWREKLKVAQRYRAGRKSTNEWDLAAPARVNGLDRM